MSEGPRWAVEGRGWPHADHSRFVAAGGLRWHVQIMGEGPVVLLLHGTGAATHSWRDLAPLLGRHYTIVAPDLPGHGFTSGLPRAGLSLPAMAAAVTSLLQVLDIEPALIVGHSAGAAIAVRMVLDGVAARGVIGLSPALQPFPGMAAKLFPTLARLLFLNPFAPHIFAGIARRTGETRRFLARTTGSQIDDAGADLYGRLFARPGHCAGATRMMADWDLEPLVAALPRLPVPLLLIHGAADAAIPTESVRRSAAAVAGARLEMLPGLGHLAHEESPEPVAASIDRFAAECGIARAATIVS
jgi:magnesium chelatase accessory protein